MIADKLKKIYSQGKKEELLKKIKNEIKIIEALDHKEQNSYRLLLRYTTKEVQTFKRIFKNIKEDKDIETHIDFLKSLELEIYKNIIKIYKELELNQKVEQAELGYRRRPSQLMKSTRKRVTTKKTRKPVRKTTRRSKK
jgi:hypothetical protein